MAENHMPNFHIDLSGQTAIVTGAGAGVGKAIAFALAQAGAAVAINDLNPDRVETVADEIKAAGGRVAAFQGDISNRFQVVSLIERAREALGRIHIFVNAAGVFKAEPMQGIDAWDWQRQVEVNITGMFYCTQLIGRVMGDEGGGVIVNIASTVGNGHTLPEGLGYATTKAGVIGLTQQSARELGPYHIRVNAVCPGHVQDNDMPVDNPPPNALQRVGTADDIAQVALFLCSDAAAFITGQAIIVDGGGY